MIAEITHDARTWQLGYDTVNTLKKTEDNMTEQEFVAMKLAFEQKLLTAVKRHAVMHYEEDGWDFVIKTCDDKELLEIIGTARSEAVAIRKVGAYFRPLAERRAEIQAERF